MDEKKKKPNSTQIAQLAGISRSTVSRVINGYPNVPEKTRKLVMDTIERYGYYPSLSGQILRGKSPRCIGVFWGGGGNISYDVLASAFLVNVIESAANRGYLSLACMPPDYDSEASRRSIKEVFHQGRIDAGIFIGANMDEPLLTELERDGLIIGALDMPAGKPDGKRFTVNFESDTGKKAVEYAVSMGHRDLAVIDGNMHRYSSFLRHGSYLEGMREAGLTVRDEWMIVGQTNAALTKRGGRESMRAILSCTKRPSIVLCNNDATAFGAYEAISEKGLTVGKDISVVGIDSHLMGSVIDPPLTTFFFDFKQIFASLTGRMIDYLEGNASAQRNEVFTSTFIERKSCVRLSK